MESDVLIAGGGLNGPALALALAGAGLRVTVIDPRPAPQRAGDRFDGRAYALALASQRLLAALGLWYGLAGDAQPIRRVIASQGRPGEGADPLFLHFDGAEIETGQLGAMIEDRFLYRALLAAMTAAPGIALVTGTRVTALRAGAAAVTVQLADGRPMTARLLVGADGRGSTVAAAAGIPRRGWDYGQTALVAAIAHERDHDGTAHQLFTPSGPLAILPLPGRRSSIVWSEASREAGGIAALDDAAFLALLRPRVGDVHGDFALAGDRFTYPLSLSLADRYAGDRLALVGDAAHGVHPVAGQGLNLGLRDVAALAEVLVEAAQRGEDIGAPAVLDRYQRWRRFDGTAMALGMDAVNRLFAGTNPLLRAARAAGMGAISATPPLRRAFMRRAAGLALEPMPRLLAGRAL